MQYTKDKLISAIMKTTEKLNIFFILILIIGMMIGAPVPAKAKIRKPSLALPAFDVKSKTKTTITLDFSYMAKYYLKGKDSIDGYQLYRKVKGKWKKLCTVKTKGKKKKSIKKTYKDKKLKTGTTYKYRVRTFKKVTGTKKVKKGKRKVTRKYKKTFYSKYEYLNVTTKKENESKPTPEPNPLLGILYDKDGNYIDPYRNTSNKNYRQDMLNEINKLRKAEGYQPLVLNETMCKMADIRAKEIYTLFEHRRPNGALWSTIFNEFNLDFTTSEGVLMSVRPTGENISSGGVSENLNASVEGVKGLYYGVSADWKDTLYEWMGSPGHKAAIMSEFSDQFAVSYCFDKKRGQYRWVQLFGASY